MLFWDSMEGELMGVDKISLADILEYIPWESRVSLSIAHHQGSWSQPESLSKTVQLLTFWQRGGGPHWRAIE